jgi:hypothetical protein
MIQVFQPWEMDNFRGLRIDRYSSRIDIWASREDTRKLFRNIEVISSLLACHICENCLSLGLARCVDISLLDLFPSSPVTSSDCEDQHPTAPQRCSDSRPYSSQWNFLFSRAVQQVQGGFATCVRRVVGTRVRSYGDIYQTGDSGFEVLKWPVVGIELTNWSLLPPTQSCSPRSVQG